MTELVREISSKPSLIEDVKVLSAKQNGKRKILNASGNETDYPSSNDGFFEIRFLDSQPSKYEEGLSYFMFGAIMLVRTLHGNFYETHSEIKKPQYRGHGYGVGLYAAAITLAKKKGIGVFSSPNTSRSAARVWESKRLNRRFDIERKKKRWIVYM